MGDCALITPVYLEIALISGAKDGAVKTTGGAGGFDFHKKKGEHKGRKNPKSAPGGAVSAWPGALATTEASGRKRVLLREGSAAGVLSDTFL